jgi:DNA polymerase III delta prime subunit
MDNFFSNATSSISAPEHQTFVAKYRPYFIQDFNTDPQFKAVLRSLIDIDDINILVTGTTNSGKTSLLSAIIRDYYHLEKHQGFPENNIMFINSLKEQGINYYRNEMRTFSQSKCSIHGKKKLVIVDDLDLINDQSQQVFRNYIDKYKSNINFVSVCSNVHKVIESIQSRVHILRLEPPSREMVEQLMDNIIQKEGLQLTVDAKKYILSFSNYSIREVITHLEKINILSVGEVDLNKCKSIISNISHKQFEEYISMLRSKNLNDAIQILYKIYDYGYSVIDILDLFYIFVKSTNNLSEDEKYRVLPCLCKYITYFHSMHEDIIEIVLFTNDLHHIISNGDELIRSTMNINI